MPQPELRVGLAGLGTVSSYHVAAMKGIAGARLVAGCDVSRPRREYFRNRWGLTTIYDSLEQMLEREKLDVVHILVPPPAHAAIALECLASSCHCFIEKPLSTSVADGQILADRAAEAGRTIAVNHNLLWMPAFLRLRNLIRENQLGRLKNVSVFHSLSQPFQSDHWVTGAVTHSIVEAAPHSLSIIIDVLGAVRHCRSRACEFVPVAGAEIVSNWQSDLICEYGAALSFVSVWNAAPSCTVFVIGERATIRADLLTNTLVHAAPAESSRLRAYDPAISPAREGIALIRHAMKTFAGYGRALLGSRTLADPFLQSMRDSLADFYRALRQGGKPTSDAGAGIEVVKAMQLVIRGLNSSD